MSPDEVAQCQDVLGQWCWIALGLMWLVFALRLNRVADWVAGRVRRKEG